MVSVQFSKVKCGTALCSVSQISLFQHSRLVYFSTCLFLFSLSLFFELLSNLVLPPLVLLLLIPLPLPPSLPVPRPSQPSCRPRNNLCGQPNRSRELSFPQVRTAFSCAALSVVVNLCSAVCTVLFSVHCTVIYSNMMRCAVLCCGALY